MNRSRFFFPKISGMLAWTLLMNSSVINEGGMSVSGYILRRTGSGTHIACCSIVFGSSSFSWHVYYCFLSAFNDRSQSIPTFSAVSATKTTRARLPSLHLTFFASFLLLLQLFHSWAIRRCEISLQLFPQEFCPISKFSSNSKTRHSILASEVRQIGGVSLLWQLGLLSKSFANDSALSLFWKRLKRPTQIGANIGWLVSYADRIFYQFALQRHRGPC